MLTCICLISASLVLEPVPSRLRVSAALSLAGAVRLRSADVSSVSMEKADVAGTSLAEGSAAPGAGRFVRAWRYAGVRCSIHNYTRTGD